MTTILPTGGQLTPAEPSPLPPPAPGSKRALSLPRPGWLAVTAAGTVAAIAVAGWAVAQNRSVQHKVTILTARVAADERQTQQLADRLKTATSAQQTLQQALTKATQRTIGASVSATVLKSVFTIDAGNALGTAFAVRRSATGGTILVTNYHVIANVWAAGRRAVTLKQGSRSISGQIVTVRPSKDLASVEVVPALPLLSIEQHVPAVGAPVLVVGSPLGLGGTVTTGVVSAHRSGLIQISAPISPGNSGGPVVDAQGRVVGIASEKVVSNFAEGLAFAIPIREICTSLVHC
ncbi:MAG: S1C family serine protease [Actinomycetes bacterium]